MTRIHPQLLVLLLAIPTVLVGGGAAHASASAANQVLLQTSLQTSHFSSNPDHNEQQDLLNLAFHLPEGLAPDWLQGERDDWRADTRWLVGGARFRNSFGQDSVYLYAGGRRDLVETRNSRTFVKLTAGLLHGYRGRYRHKIPLNDLGVAPAILPSVGVEYGRLNVELVAFGTAGMMTTVGFYLR